MTTLRTSYAALAAALTPLALLHLMTVILVVSAGGDPRLRTADATLGALAGRLALDAVLMGGLHFGLRALGRGDRASYALAGGAAGVLSYGLGLATGFWPQIAPDGSVVTAGLAPLVAGALGGVLYHQLAGRDWAAGVPGVGPGQPVPTFAGPLQVRTSFGAFALLILGPLLVCAAAYAVASFGQVVRPNRSVLVGAPGSAPWAALAVPLGAFFGTFSVVGLPILFVAAAAHGIARAMNRIDVRAYAFIGFACTATLPLLFGRGGLSFAAIPLGLLGALIAISYRRLAGLEPKSLPEHLVVREREALVGADHPARSSRRLVFED